MRHFKTGSITKQIAYLKFEKDGKFEEEGGYEKYVVLGASSIDTHILNNMIGTYNSCLQCIKLFIGGRFVGAIKKEGKTLYLLNAGILKLEDDLVRGELGLK